MKTRIFLFSLLSALLFPSCNGFLDLEPEAALSPEQYLTTEENIGAYANDLYTMLPISLEDGLIRSIKHYSTMTASCTGSFGEWWNHFTWGGRSIVPDASVWPQKTVH